MDDGEEDCSRTVTIALDLSPPVGGDGEKNAGGTEQQQNNLKQQLQLLNTDRSDLQKAKLADDADFLTISSPPSSSDLLRPWRWLRSNASDNCKKIGTSPDGIVRVRHLRADMAQLLEQRLNPPGCGSMRNWEFVAAHLGLDIEQIVQMRSRTKNPMGALMRQFGDEPLLRLLELIGEAGRIDVLISVRQFAEKPVGDKECQQRSVANASQQFDSALINSSSSALIGDHFGRSASTSSTASVRSVDNSAFDFGGPSQLQQQRFILILHHEKEENRDLRKFHRMLTKNLGVYAKEEGIKIVDVDQCMSDQDLLGTVSRYFERADQVIMELSPDYAELINVADQIDNSDQRQSDQWSQIDQRIRIKLYLHQMTYNEVLLNSNQNRRFRVVLMQGCRPEHVPRGWPGNTLHYRFPQDFEALCRRLFDHQQQQQKGMMMMITK